MERTQHRRQRVGRSGRQRHDKGVAPRGVGPNNGRVHLHSVGHRDRRRAGARGEPLLRGHRRQHSRRWRQLHRRVAHHRPRRQRHVVGARHHRNLPNQRERQPWRVRLRHGPVSAAQPHQRQPRRLARCAAHPVVGPPREVRQPARHRVAGVPAERHVTTSGLPDVRQRCGDQRRDAPCVASRRSHIVDDHPDRVRWCRRRCPVGLRAVLRHRRRVDPRRPHCVHHRRRCQRDPRRWVRRRLRHRRRDPVQRRPDPARRRCQQHSTRPCPACGTRPGDRHGLRQRVAVPRRAPHRARCHDRTRRVVRVRRGERHRLDYRRGAPHRHARRGRRMAVVREHHGARHVQRHQPVRWAPLHRTLRPGDRQQRRELSRRHDLQRAPQRQP